MYNSETCQVNWKWMRRWGTIFLCVCAQNYTWVNELWRLCIRLYSITIGKCDPNSGNQEGFNNLLHKWLDRKREREIEVHRIHMKRNHWWTSMYMKQSICSYNKDEFLDKFWVFSLICVYMIPKLNVVLMSYD